MLRLSTAGLSLLLLAACSSSTSPERERPPFSVGPVDSPEAPEGATNPPTVRVREGGLEVLGIITTGHPCHEIDAMLQRDDRSLAITIVAVAEDGPCFTVIANFAYAVEVDDLQPGSYRVTVAHSYENSGWPTTEVLDEVVAVP